MPSPQPMQAPTRVLELPVRGSDGSSLPLLARGRKRDYDYLPSWDSGGEYVSEGHRRLLEGLVDAPPQIEGLLYPPDALKLYELAWFTPGPILEIGTFQGFSATIMARSLAEAGSPARVYSIDVDGDSLATARANLASEGLLDRVSLAESDAASLARALPELRPYLVFVDGDHTFRGVSRDLEVIRDLVPTGGILMFHDFEGYENPDPYWTQVRQAVGSSWVAEDCEFLGRFGVSGVFARERGGPPAGPAQPGDIPVAGLSGGRLRRRVIRRVTTIFERPDLPLTGVRRRLLALVDRAARGLRRALGRR